jgi:hypothetical protein
MMSENIDPKQIYAILLLKKLKSDGFSKIPFVDFLSNTNNMSDIGAVKGMQELFLQISRNDNEKTCKQAHDEILEILKNDHGLNISA